MAINCQAIAMLQELVRFEIRNYMQRTQVAACSFSESPSAPYEDSACGDNHDRLCTVEDDIVTLKADLEEIRKESSEKDCSEKVDVEEVKTVLREGLQKLTCGLVVDIVALKADLEEIRKQRDVKEMKTDLNKMMPLFQEELESFQEELHMINKNTFSGYDFLKSKLQNAEKELSRLEKELQEGLSWLTEPTEVWHKEANRSKQKQKKKPTKVGDNTYC